MTRKPDHITFTGVDEWTPIEGMRALSERYPIEWGILFSPKRQGIDPRYPDGEVLSRLMWSDLRMAAHLCGGYSEAVMKGMSLSGIPADLSYFGRIQVNHASPQPSCIIQFRNGWGDMRCIAQCREGFPLDTAIDWLFDRSGGTGHAPGSWPRHPGGSRLVGYAGGIGPDNVLDVITAIDATGPYWIDMESGVRTDNRFDLAKCQADCEAVYGAGA